MDEKKKAPSILSIPGTKLSSHNAQLLISSGISFLDSIVGGGFAVGTIVLLQEDLNGTYAQFVLKYFLAEGIANRHSIFVASKDRSAKQFVNELPCVVDDNSDLSAPSQSTTSESMKIAFRYQNLQPQQSVGQPYFGHVFDLSTPISPLTCNNIDATYYENRTSNPNDSYAPYRDILQMIHDSIKEKQLFLMDNPEKRSLLRIGIHSLGSPLWRSDGDEDEGNVKKFFYTLRALMRSSFSVAFVTVPKHMFSNVSRISRRNVGMDLFFNSCCVFMRQVLLERVINSSDVVFRLLTFSGTNLENVASLSKYHGFFYVDKIACINSFLSKYQGPADYAFKLLRKKFLIELLHLPPELQASTEREQDDFPSVGCGSSKKNLLEF